VRKISILALFVGGVVSYLAAAVVAIPFGIVVAAKAGVFRQPPNPQTAAVVRALSFSDPSIYYGSIAINCACAVLGGYLAAVTARRSEALNGLASSLVFVALEVAGIRLSFDPHPVQVHVLHMVGIVIASWLGGYLRGMRVRGAKSKTTLVRT
jgi:putative membrane protein (TIGR04086 family)